MNRETVLILALTLSGCGSNPGIVPIADGIYMNSRMNIAPGYNSGSEVKVGLYKEANDFCATKGKKLVPLTSASSDSGYGHLASAEIQFKCE